MARPKRNEAVDLAERVMAACRKSYGSSLSRLAREVGVWPSTLSRSVRDQRFSKELRDKLEHILGREPSGGPVSATSNDESLQKTLHLLTELHKLIPDLQKRLAAALDPQTGARQTADQ